MRLTLTILFWILTAALGAAAETKITTQSIAIPHHLMWYTTTGPEDILMVYMRIDSMTAQGHAPGFHYETTGDVKFFKEPEAFRFLLSRYRKTEGLSTNLNDFAIFFRYASGSFPKFVPHPVKPAPAPTAAMDPNLITRILTADPGLLETKVYLSKTGTKYHRYTCQYLGAGGRETTLCEALLENYTACLMCKPGTLEKK